MDSRTKTSINCLRKHSLEYRGMTLEEFKKLSQNESSSMLCALIERSSSERGGRQFTSKELKRRIRKLEQHLRKNLYDQDVVQAIHRVKSDRNSQVDDHGFGRDLTNEMNQSGMIQTSTSKKRKLNQNERSEVLRRIHFRNCVLSEEIWSKLINIFKTESKISHLELDYSRSPKQVGMFFYEIWEIMGPGNFIYEQIVDWIEPSMYKKYDKESDIAIETFKKLLGDDYEIC